jgi:hypothetical protein
VGPADIQRARTLTLLGDVSRRLDGADKAVFHLRDALAIVSSRGFAPLESWRTLHEYSRALRDLEERGGAIYFAKQAVNAIQASRSGTVELDRALQQSFLIDKAVVYRDLADLLVDEGRLGEALEVLRLLKEEEHFDFTQRDGNAEPGGRGLR